MANQTSWNYFTDSITAYPLSTDLLNKDPTPTEPIYEDSGEIELIVSKVEASYVV